MTLIGVKPQDAGLLQDLANLPSSGDRKTYSTQPAAADAPVGTHSVLAPNEPYQPTQAMKSILDPVMDRIAGSERDQPEANKFMQWWNSDAGQIRRDAFTDSLGHTFAGLASIPLGGGDMSAAGQHFGAAQGSLDRAKQRFHTSQYRSRVNALLKEEYAKPKDQQDQNKIWEYINAMQNPASFDAGQRSAYDRLQSQIQLKQTPNRAQKDIEEAAQAIWDASTQEERDDLLTPGGKMGFLYDHKEFGDEYLQYFVKKKLLVKKPNDDTPKEDTGDWLDWIASFFSSESEKKGGDAGDPELDAMATTYDAKARNKLIVDGGPKAMLEEMRK